MKLIDRLAEAGFEVYIGHARYFTGHKHPLSGDMAGRAVKAGATLKPTGGYTEVHILKHGFGMSSTFYGHGIARCNKSDTFDRKFGEDLATWRAFDDAISRSNKELGELVKKVGFEK